MLRFVSFFFVLFQCTWTRVVTGPKGPQASLGRQGLAALGSGASLEIGSSEERAGRAARGGSKGRGEQWTGGGTASRVGVLLAHPPRRRRRLPARQRATGNQAAPSPESHFKGPRGLTPRVAAG